MSVNDKGDFVSPKDLPNPFGRISDIAKRLGVGPTKGAGSVTMTGTDGNVYDVWDVLDALLDRLDEVVPPKAVS